MKTARAWLCLLIVAALCMSLGACGKNAEEEQANPGEQTVTETKNMTEDAEPEDNEDDNDEDDAPIDEDSLVIKGKTTTKPSETAASLETGTATSTASAAVTTKTDTKTTADVSTEAASGTITTETEAVVTDPEPDVPAEENVVSGIIDLTDGSFEGEGISVNGGTILITGEGTYILSGTRTGMVEVNSTKKVKLKLNGVSITNPSGPAILCTDAKKLTITLIEGTYNSLSDGVNPDFDGAVCSNDTLEIKGAGALNVTANNAHGIASDDDLIIKNGDITVNAVKTGLMANDDITISGGTLHVTGATNGIKSKGTLHISGGTIFTIGGPKETKSALYSAGAFSLTGGYIYALGCGASDPDPGSSTQSAISAKYVPSLAAGSTASVVCGGLQFMRETSPYAFNTVFISTPDIDNGQPFSVFANDVEYGSGFVTNGIITSVTAGPGAAPAE